MLIGLVKQLMKMFSKTKDQTFSFCILHVFNIVLAKGRCSISTCLLKLFGIATTDREKRGKKRYFSARLKTSAPSWKSRTFRAATYLIFIVFDLSYFWFGHLKLCWGLWCISISLSLVYWAVIISDFCATEEIMNQNVHYVAMTTSNHKLLSHLDSETFWCFFCLFPYFDTLANVWMLFDAEKSSLLLFPVSL